MNFALVQDPYFKPAWHIVVRSLEELMDWYTSQQLVSEGFLDILRGPHATTPIGALHESLTRLGLAQEGHASADFLSRAVLTPKREAVLRGETVLISPGGGWCTLLEGYHSIQEEREGEPMAWPDQEGLVKLSQWRKGGHYYARLNGQEVVVDGEVKWNTRRLALAAVERFKQEGPS